MGLNPLLIKLWPYLTFMNTAIEIFDFSRILEQKSKTIGGFNPKKEDVLPTRQ